MGHRQLLDEAIQWTELEAGQPTPDGPPLLLVIDDRSGLTELATRVAADPVRPVVLYTGDRPSVVAHCMRLGAVDVLCMGELTTGSTELASQLDHYRSLRLPTRYPVDALNALPLAVALREPDGRFSYRNPAHQRLPFATDAVTATAELDMEQVTDPISGRLFLRSHTPLENGPHAAPPLVLEVLEEITGRHTDQSEIARQRDDLSRHARALAQANRELERLDRAKARFIALAAHEIRTPLTALTNAIHLVGEGDGSERHQRMLAMADRNLRRLSVLAEDLLEFTKLDTGHAVLDTEPLDLHHCLHTVLNDSRAEAEAQGIRLSAPTGPLPALWGDPARMAVMLRTLVAHAIRRAPEQSAVAIAIVHQARWQVAPPDGPGRSCPQEPRLPTRPDGWVEIRVSDCGPTPDEAVCEALFSGFGAGREGVVGETPGAGLDLALCARVAAVHGGICWAEAPASGAVGEGLSAIIRLPRLDQASAPLLAVAERLTWLNNRQALPCLLLVEGDSELLRAILHNDPALHQPAGPERDPSLDGFGDAFGDGDPAHTDHPAPLFSRAGDQRLVGVVAGGSDAARAALARVQQSLTCSFGDYLPIRGGWTLAAAEEPFEQVLGRARATLTPLSDRPQNGPPDGATAVQTD